MIIVVFLFLYRGENERDRYRYHGNECEHVGPVDPVGLVI